MIDTIVLRIHNLKKYPTIYEQYYNPAAKKGSFTQAFIDEDTGEVSQHSFSPAIVFHDRNRILMPRHRNTNLVASSHYDLSYVVDTEKDFIEFNFSIPKYLYATNIMQLVNEIDQGVGATFSKLYSFIGDFLRDNFLKSPLLEDVEIHRIDLCYNQFFNSKEDALNYLDEQKKLLASKRSKDNKVRSYDSSIMYTTRRYSFKIYHKGTEFERHDYKKLLKRNPLNYPLGYFLDNSHCILRYEMTFRSSYLSYLMQQHFFVSEKKQELTQFENHPITQLFKKFIRLGYKKVYENYRRTGKFFTFKSIFDSTKNDFNLLNAMLDHNSSSKVGKSQYNFLDTVSFDQTIFQMVFDAFWLQVRSFQLERVMDITELSRRIDKYKEDVEIRRKMKMSNSKEERSLDKTRLLICGLLVAQNYNIDNLKKYIPERTFYRIKAELKSLGILTHHTNISVAMPKLDYQDYRMIFGKYHRY